MPLRPTNASLAFLALLVTALLAGCGGDEPGTSPASTTSATTTSEKHNTDGSKEESIEDVEEEFVAALDSGDCDRINELNPSTRPSLQTKAQCDVLKLFTDFEPTGSEDYGDGAVIDLKDDEKRYASAIFTRESDGSLSLVVIDNLRTGKTVGTKPAKEFDDAAAEAATALREKDCDAFVDASYVRRGYAVGEPKTVCERLKAFPVADLAAKLGDAPPELVGGNSEYAFYTLGQGEYRVVLIMAHQVDLAELGNPPEVPEGGAEYGLLDVFPVLPPESAKDSDSSEEE